MRRTATLTFVLLLTTACVADPPAAVEQAPARPPAAEEAWLEKIEARAATLRTLAARLRIVVSNPVTGDEQVRFGDLLYDAGPPGRFSVHLDLLVVDGGRGEKMNTWYVFDGRWLLERNHDTKTAVRRQVVPPEVDPADADPLGLGKGPFPLPLRAKKDDILARYEVTLHEPADGDPPNTVHLRLTPRDAAVAGPSRLDLWYDRDTLLPVRAASIAEDETSVTLLKSTADDPIDPAAFDTTPPTERGWTVEQRPWEER